MKTAVLLACAAVAFAGPVDRSGTCSRHCTESRKFDYKPGTTYVYSYTTSTETSMQGTTSDKAAVYLSCQVELESLGGCDYTIQIRGTSLEEQDPSSPGRRRPSPSHAELKQALELNPLKFSYEDGRVENICPSEGDSPRVLNIKKGILSVIQNSMQRLEGNEDIVEVDISGKCPTVYETLPKGWTSLTIRKTKDLSQCKDRESSITALQATAEEGNLRSMPVVKGEQECKQTYKNSILESVECKEKHVVRPFSRQENGAVTNVFQSMTLRTQRRSVPSRTIYTAAPETDMLFDHDYDVEEAARTLARAEDVLRQLVDSSGEVIQSSAPGMFTELVFSLRKLNNKDLQTVFHTARNLSPKAKKFFMDALPSVATAASVRMMTESMVNGEVTGLDADAWLTSLAFVSQPTLEMVKEALPLIKLDRSQAYLGVSTLAHSYCRANPDCNSAHPIKELARSLYLTLGENCYARDARTTLMVLKALGNLGESEGSEETLNRCFQNPQLDIEIRLAAVEAFRRFSCDIPRNEMLRTYQNVHENVELRIAGYLAAIKCPSNPVIESVRDAIRNESIKQVGSFVYSHIRNLAKEPSPFQTEYRAIANDVELKNKFELDFRKFSRNIHYRMFFDPLDTGFELDANVIYTPESYYPRSLMVGTSFDIFGKKINLFEAGARAEQVDKYIQKWFPQDQQNTIRSRRAISDNKIDELGKKFAVKEKYGGDAKASGYLRFFGNEIAGIQIGGNAATPFSELSEWIVKMSDSKGLDLSKSVLFADTSLTVPASNGLPLRVSVNGSATAAISVGGKSQMKKGGVDINGQIKPSGAVELSMLMSVDAHKSVSGVKMVATMSSSWVVDGSLQVQQGQAVKAQINMPRNEMELIDVKSKIFLVNSMSEVEHRNEPQKKMETEACTGSTMEKMLGIQICGKAEFPVSSQTYGAPMYPFSGNAELSLVLKKTDASLTSYNFEAGWTNNQDVKGAMVTMSTPGTTMDREIKAELQHNIRDRTVALRLKTPPKKFTLEGKYNFDEKLKKIDLNAKLDEASIFQLVSELKADTSQNDVTRYSHFLEIHNHGTSILLLNGQWNAVHGRKYSGNLNIEKITEKPVLLKVDLDMMDKNRVKYEAVIKSFFVDGKMDGYTQSGENWATKMNGEFSLMEGRPEKIDFTAKFRDLSAGSLTKYNGAASLQNTFHPSLNTDLLWDCQVTDGLIENSLEIKRGTSGKKTIRIQQIAKYTGTLSNNNAGLTLKLKYPQNKIDWSLEMSHENTENSLLNRMTLNYAPGRQLSTAIDVAIQPQTKLDVQVNYPGRETRLSGNYRNVGSDEYKGNLLAQWSREKKIEASGTFRLGAERRQYSPSFEIEILIPNRRPVTVSGALKAAKGYYTIKGASQCSVGRHELNAVYRSANQYNHDASIKIETPRDNYAANGVFKIESDKVVANANVKLGRVREVSIESELTSSRDVKLVKFDCKWDAAKDPSRRATINGEFRRVSGGYQGNFAVKCPKQDIRGTVSTTTQGRLDGGLLRISSTGEIEWQPRKKATYVANIDWNPETSRRVLKADMTITTPFQKADILGLTLTHRYDGREWASEGRMTLPQRRILSIASDGDVLIDRSRRIIKGNVKVNTPAGKEFSLMATHSLSQFEINNMVKFHWDEGKAVAAEVSGAYGRGMLRGKAEVITPIIGYERVGASFDHAHGPAYVRCQASAQWKRGQEVSFSLNGQHTSTGLRKVCEADIRITTPIRGLELMSSKMTYNNDGKKLSADIEASNGYNKITTGLSASKKRQRGGDASSEMRLYFNSPVQGYENLEVTGTYSVHQEKVMVSADAKLPYSKTASLRSQGRVASMNNFDSSITIQLPIRNYEQLKMEVAHNIHSRSLKTTGLIAFGRNEYTAVLNGDIMYSQGSSDITGMLTITTPIRAYEAISMNLRQTRRGGNLDCRLGVAIGQSSLTVVHDMKIGDNGNFEQNLEIITPFKTMSSLTVRNTNQLQNGRLSHSTEIEWQRRNKVALNIDASSSSTRNDYNMDANVRLITPWRALSNANIKASNYYNHQEVKSKVSTEWNNGENIALEWGFQNDRYRSLESKLQLTSSIKAIEMVTVNAKYDVSSEQKTGELSFQWDPRPEKMVTLTGSASLKEGASDIDISCTTPISGYERVQLLCNYKNEYNAKSASITLQSQWKKIALVGNLQNSRTGSTAELSLATPIRGLELQKISGEYSTEFGKLMSKVDAEWSGKMMSLESELEKADRRASAKVTFKTPFEGMRNMEMNLNGNFESNTKVLSSMLQCDAKTIELSATIDTTDRTAKFQLRSPFENLEEIELNAGIEDRGRTRQVTASISWAPGKMINIESAAAPESIKLTLTTPFRGYRRLSGSGAMENRGGSSTFNAVFEKENKKIALSTSNSYNRDLEGTIKLTTPFRSYEELSMAYYITYEGIKNMKASFSLRTPIEGAQTIDIKAETSIAADQYRGLISLEAPNSRYELNGQMTYQGIRLVDGQMSLITPHQQLRTANLKVNLRTGGLRFINGGIALTTPGGEHALSLDIKNSGPFEGSFEVNCPLLPQGKATVSYMVNVPNKDFADFRITAGFGEESHKVLGSYENKRSIYRSQISLDSPKLKEGPASFKLELSSLRPREIKAVLSFGFERNMNTINIDAGANGGVLKCKVSAESLLLPSRSLTAEGIVTTTRQGADISMIFEDPKTSHRLNANWKQVAGTADGQLRIESPLLSFNSLTGTITYSNTPNLMEGTLVMETPKKTIKCFGALRGSSLRNFEGNLNLETPFESLRFANIDINFNNEYDRVMDGSLSIKTSVPSLISDANISGQIRNNPGSFESSLKGRLPIGMLSNFEQTFVCKYNNDLTSISPRLTVTLPNFKVVDYAEINYARGGFQLTAGHEWGADQKIEALIAIKKPAGQFKVDASLSTPFRNMETFEVSMMCARESDKRVFRASYKAPSRNIYEIQHSNTYYNPLNFNVENSVTTPIRGFELMSLRVRQQSSRSRLVSNLEGNLWRRRMIFNLDHDKNANKGNVQITSPYQEARSVKLTYDINKYKVDGELTVNDRRMIKIAGNSEYVHNLRSHKCDAVVDIPAIRTALEAHYKPVSSGLELASKFSSSRRTITFDTLFQKAPENFVHQASLKWGQGKGEEFSYDIRATHSRRRDLKNTDMSCKVNFPLRAFEVRASQSQKNNVKTMSCDLFWDAARDQSKHMTLNLEHQNLSSRSVWAHKVAATLSHPRLSKEIVMRLDGSLSSDELHGKTELEYSRDQNHNLVLEGRCKRRGPSHVTVELTARQPVSSMDIRTMAELKDARDEVSALISVNYMNRNRQMRVHELKASIFKLRKAIDILLRSGRDQSQLKGEMYNRDQEFGMELEHQVNLLPPTKTHLRINKRHSNVEIAYNSPDDYSAIMSASASPDKRELKLSHRTLGRSVSDLLLKMALKEKRYLGSEVSWRPELTKEAREYASQRYNTLCNEASRLWSDFASETEQELRAKRFIMGQSLQSQIRPVLEDIERDLGVLSSEISQAADKLETMYYQDEFYMKTVLSTMSAAAWEARCAALKIGRLVLVATKGAVDVCTNVMTAAGEKITIAADRVAFACRRSLIFAEKVLSVVIDRTSLAAARATEWAMYKVEGVASKLMQKTIALLERYGPSPSIVRDAYNKAVKMVSVYTAPIIESIAKNPLVQGLYRYVERVCATLNAFSMESIKRRSYYAYNTVANNVIEVTDNILVHPHVKYVKNMAQNIARKARDISEQLGMPDMAAGVIEMGKQQIQDGLLNGLSDAVREYSNLRSGMRVEYAPERGVMSAELRLPSSKANLAEALDITSYPEYDKIMGLKDNYYGVGANSVWDAYYKYSHYGNPRHWMPPFKARALMAGPQHYRTFDGFHFEFAGECSYLLAKDFLNDQFAVIINYVRDGHRVVKKSITVNSDGQRFDISSDYKVTQGGNKVELPQDTGATTIRREGHVVIVENNSGLTVRCNLYYDQCVTEITGDHFGKTGGLLGTYDYEDKLDLMTPDRRITDDPTVFANEWEVGHGRCRSQQNMAQPMVTDSRATSVCKNLFEEEKSVFRSCFKMVDPKPYLKMCLHDMSSASYDQMEKATCVSAAAYREECNEFGVELEMPRTCVRCEKPDGSEILSGEITTVTEDESVNTADVIFVVERKLCNKNVMPNLIRLAQGLDERYASKGFSNMRYAVVGFGGDGVAELPHIVTADGQVFNSIRSIISAFSSLTVGNGNSDVFSALKYAAKLPTRMGSSQVMMLVKCTTCTPGEDPSVYTDIYRMLIDRGMHLHILDDDDFAVRTAAKPSKSKRIFGVDHRLAYTAKDLKEMHGDADIHSQIRLPKDFCVPLALETNGTLFSSLKMFEKRNVNKKFIDVMARRVALSEAPDCQICECVSAEDGVGQSLCNRCVSPTLGPVRSPDFSPSMYDEVVERKGYKRPKTKKLRHRK